MERIIAVFYLLFVIPIFFILWVSSSTLLLVGHFLRDINEYIIDKFD